MKTTFQLNIHCPIVMLYVIAVKLFTYKKYAIEYAVICSVLLTKVIAEFSLLELSCFLTINASSE